MGRETVALAHWDGKSAMVKALLESTEIILRGEIRAKMSRSSIASISVEENTLQLISAGQLLRLELGHSEALKWAATLSKPPPTLAEKLGIDATHRAFVMGSVDDDELRHALSEFSTTARSDAAVVVAVLRSDTDLPEAIKLGQVTPICPVWCVYGKGKFASVSDSTIRNSMRASGFIDNKTSGISEKITATRYQFRSNSSSRNGK